MKKLHIPIVLVCFVIALTGVSCKKNSTTNTTTKVAYTPTCSTTKSFSTDVFPLIQSNCNTAGCHSNLSNYSQIKSLSGSIRSDVVNGTMPRGSSLSSSQKDIIVCWIDAGAPNN